MRPVMAKLNTVSRLKGIAGALAKAGETVRVEVKKLGNQSPNDNRLRPLLRLKLRDPFLHNFSPASEPTSRIGGGGVTIALIIIVLLTLSIIVLAFFRAGSIADERDREMIRKHFDALGDDPHAVAVLRGKSVHHGDGF